MTFDASQFVADYMTVGGYCFDASDIMAKIDIDKFRPAGVEYPDGCFHAEGYEHYDDFQSSTIEKLRNDISTTILKDMVHELVFDFLAFSVNMNVRNWHNDAQYNMEDQNTSINCFFDDCSPEVGGCFEMIPYTTDLKPVHPESTKFYPKKNSIIIFNQNRNFFHRALPSINPRRMISFGCTLKEFNSLLPNFSVK